MHRRDEQERAVRPLPLQGRAATGDRRGAFPVAASSARGGLAVLTPNTSSPARPNRSSGRAARSNADSRRLPTPRRGDRDAHVLDAAAHSPHASGTAEVDHPGFCVHQASANWCGCRPWPWRREAPTTVRGEPEHELLVAPPLPRRIRGSRRIPGFTLVVERCLLTSRSERG